jgi:very-short-patch-repair endonuclease
VTEQVTKLLNSPSVIEIIKKKALNCLKINRMDQAQKANNFFYNPKLKERGRALRRKGTKAEAYMWKFILRNQQMGYKFLRQRPVLNYIADFMCPELMLIIEVDGITHQLEGAAERDKNRQTQLEQAGFTVLRFDDNTVINHLNMVTTIIQQEIERLANLQSNTHKTSPP